MKYLLKILSLIVFFSTSNVFAIEIKARTAILQDFLSGKILYENEPEMEIYPASMTKIMTAIVAFDLIKTGDLSLDDKFLISDKAWRLSKSGYSSMFIMPGDEISVDNLLKGIIIVSGNDACVALAEGIAGSEEEFAILMTAKAKEIGMTNSNFANASGINHIENYSTVKDILIMSNYLIKYFPEYYTYFREKTFTWDRTGGDPITQGNRNPLLYKNLGADGIKTGYLAVEGYSLASTIIKNNRRLIAVGSGFKSKNSRSKESSKLLIWGLTNFDTIEVAKNKKPFSSIDIWQGKKKELSVYADEDIYITIPKGKKRQMRFEINYDGPIKAPIEKDEIVATFNIFLKDELISKHNLYSFEKIKKINIFSRLLQSFNFLIWGDV